MIFMNKKGFTLVELLAVIVILGLLIAIISPVVKNLINDSENNLSEQQKKLVVEATKKYMIENSELLPEGSNRAIVYMSDLIDKGVIDNDKIIDPKSKGEINGCVVVSYNNEFNQYDYNYSDNENDCLITVTFDPEGGSVDTTSKQVKLNSTYGELPTPTREGYTFKGWRGKNMFDEEAILMAINGAKYENGYYVFKVTDARNSYGRPYGKIPIDSFNENTQYTYTVFGHVVSNANVHTLKFYFYYDDGTSSYKDLFSFDDKLIMFTSEVGKSIISNEFSWNSSSVMAYISHIQLEKGNISTEYEPYQEYSSDTVVTKSSNHTLHAIWEPSSYTVTFDPEGGSVGTTSKQVTFNSTYGELPTPTREGYRFLGWSGKNMFSNDNVTTNNTETDTYVTFQDNSIIFDASNVEGNRISDGIYVRTLMNGTLVTDAYGFANAQGVRYQKMLNLNGNNAFNRIGIKTNNNKRDAAMSIKNVLNQSKKYTVSFNVDMLDFDHAKAIISNLQLEDGEVATEYEPFKQYSSDTVVTKSSNHTLHAIWEIAS